MNNKEESFNYFNSSNYDEKYLHESHPNNPDWQFQKVQSIIQVAKHQSISPHHQNICQTNPNALKGFFNTQLHYQRKYQPQQRYNNLSPNYLNFIQDNNKINQNNDKNKFSKSNTQTNVVSQNQSMQYISSQQPSISNKGDFTILQDFNLDSVSPVKKNPSKQHYNNNLQHYIRNIYLKEEPNNDFINKKEQYVSISKITLNKPQFNLKYRPQMQKEHSFQWQAASFAPQNKHKLSLGQKCMRLFEYVQELKFMKQGFESKLKQQKILFTNEIQQIKKHVFSLNIKYQKQLLSFSKNINSQQKDRILHLKQSSVKSEDSSKQAQLRDLRKHCRKLQEQKLQSEQRYQNTLKIYQQQIENISQQLQNRLSLQSQRPRFGTESQRDQCSQCLKYQQIASQAKSLSSYQIQIWKNRLQQQHEKHEKVIKRLEEKVFSLQDQFQFLQKNKIQIQKQLKNKQKQILLRQSQLQYRLKDIQKRQRQIQMREKFIQKQKNELERKKQKITDYQLKIFKEERKYQNQFKQKQIMASEYFTNCQKREILIKHNRPPLQRSDSRSSRSSKIDINARLKQIQLFRNNGSRNQIQNYTSRNSSTDSRISGQRQLNSPRVNLNLNKNLKQYGNIANINSIGNKNQYGRQSSQMIKLNQKLSSLTQTIQKQLREIG